MIAPLFKLTYHASSMIGHKAHYKKCEFSYWVSDNDTTKETVLLIHGYGGAYAGLEDLARELGEHFRIVALDLPGYGPSEPLRKRHTLTNYAHFLNDFCSMKEFRRLHVVGHSFGADIAMVFAAKHPDKVLSLTLIGPVLFLDRSGARTARWYFKLIKQLPSPLRHRLLHNHAATYLSNQMMFKQANAEQRRRILRNDYINDHLMSDRPSIEGYFSMLSIDFLAIARDIPAKTLVLAGSADPLSPEKDMQKLRDNLPDGLLKIVQHGGHFLPMERAATTSNFIERFIYNNQ